MSSSLTASVPGALLSLPASVVGAAPRALEPHLLFVGLERDLLEPAVQLRAPAAAPRRRPRHVVVQRPGGGRAGPAVLAAVGSTRRVRTGAAAAAAVVVVHARTRPPVRQQRAHLAVDHLGDVGHLVVGDVQLRHHLGGHAQSRVRVRVEGEVDVPDPPCIIMNKKIKVSRVENKMFLSLSFFSTFNGQSESAITCAIFVGDTQPEEDASVLHPLALDGDVDTSDVQLVVFVLVEQLVDALEHAAIVVLVLGVVVPSAAAAAAIGHHPVARRGANAAGMVVVVQARGLVQVVVHGAVVRVVSVAEAAAVFQLQERVAEQLGRARPPRRRRQAPVDEPPHRGIFHLVQSRRLYPLPRDTAVDQSIDG